MNNGLTPDGKSIVPSAYLLKSINLTNHKGEIYDIKQIVTEFSIKESIYSPTLIAKFSVKDATNTIELHSIIGQEKVEIELDKKDEDNIKTIKLSFIVTEYPLYSKENNDQLQVFSFSAVSEHAYLNKLKKISRAYDGNTTDIIKLILENDLNFNPDMLNITKSNTALKGVYTYNNPLTIADKLLNISSNDVQSPYYMFQTLNGKINIQPLSELLSQKPYHKYVKAKEYKANPMGKDDFVERLSKILEITSDLKLGTIFQMESGTYAAESNKLDISNKTYNTTLYKYSENFKAAAAKNLSPTFKLDEEILESYTKAYCEYISTNPISYSLEGEKESLNGERAKNGSLIHAHSEMLETLTHDIDLYGDLDLTAGTLITLTLPKAISPDAKRKYGYDSNDTVDEFLSGDYLITGTVHKFKQGKYFIKARVKKDTLNL